MNELKPCPFCGGTDIQLVQDADVYYCCMDCGTEGPWYWSSEKNPWGKPTDTLEEFAIRAWNRRAYERDNSGD